MVSYKEFIFIDIIRIIFNSLPLSFRSVDDKAQNILSKFLQITKKEINNSDYSANYLFGFQNNLSINLCKRSKR